jgi:UDP-3-O-[3-hydroxymyristoyl] glucosamine N-acyltransferase
MVYALAELAARFGGELLGDGTVLIRQVAPLARAEAGEIGFVSQSKYLSQLVDTRASAVILPLDAQDATQLPRILTANPYLYFARVSALLNPPVLPPAGIHPSAVVDADAVVAADASIGPGAVIGRAARIGARSVVGANCVIGDEASLGEDCLLHPNVTLNARCQVGDRAILHSGCVIGSDGYGYEFHDGRHVKIDQVGIVEIGDDVEIGANTTIDRARFGKTVIGEVLGITSPAERDAGTIACLVRGLVARANIFRVHHVKAVADSVRVIAAIRGEFSHGYSHSSASPSSASRGG